MSEVNECESMVSSVGLNGIEHDFIKGKIQGCSSYIQLQEHKCIFSHVSICGSLLLVHIISK